MSTSREQAKLKQALIANGFYLQPRPALLEALLYRQVYIQTLAARSRYFPCKDRCRFQGRHKA